MLPLNISVRGKAGPSWLIALRSKEQAAKLMNDVLKRFALGTLVNLDSYFYSSGGRSFVESLLEDPVGTYAKTLNVLPESMAKSVIRIALRSLGSFSVMELESALSSLKAGDPRPFLNLVFRTSE